MSPSPKCSQIGTYKFYTHTHKKLLTSCCESNLQNTPHDYYIIINALSDRNEGNWITSFYRMKFKLLYNHAKQNLQSKYFLNQTFPNTPNKAKEYLLFSQISRFIGDIIWILNMRTNSINVKQFNQTVLKQSIFTAYRSRDFKRNEYE